MNTSDEAGESLIELLIAVSILAIGVLGIVAMLGNSLRAAGRLRGRSEVGQVVTRAADTLQRTAWVCSAATPLTSYDPALAPLLPNAQWRIELLAVSHWGPSRAFEPGCPAADASPVFRTLQLTVRITAPGDRGTQTFDTVKRP